VKKKIVIGLAVLLLVAFFVPTALAAEEGIDQELADLYQQLVNIRKQILDKYVALGFITPEQGNFLKERLDLNYKYWQQNPNAGYGYGYGCGMMGFGPAGYGPMMGYGMMGYGQMGWRGGFAPTLTPGFGSAQ